ncbi:MAG: 30S ribosomal protein S12 methylthiotransferase RimO [bacterium]|nr:30S ribosomal protein S12 methylthiotransferase RimO [bacterium]MCM1424412.1 30S ribosomal protein S12 methylthiotransferase RimO [bacterium]
MLGILRERGYVFTDDETEAEAAVVNTCCFIGDAKEESVNTILELASLKETGSLKALIVTGCLAERYREEIRREIEEVDAVIGTTAIDRIADTLDQVFAGSAQDVYDDLDRKPLTDGKRVVTTGGHFAYLKIAEGCDKRCTYCIIPKVRGPYRSVPMESLLREARTLVGQGVKELILVAQETTVYGKDLYGRKALPELLRKLCKIDGLVWIRLLYCYPEEIDEELIRVIKEEEKICHYLDLPIQHASDAVLKRMGRRTDREELIRIIERLREEIPDICLRTTLISGFPGETKKDHEELLSFVKRMRFDRLGVFPYSREEDTAAAGMPGQISEKVKCARRDEIMALQQEIAFEMAAGMEGRTLSVMIEGKVADEDAYVARTYRDAPEVDGLLFCRTQRELMTGDFVQVRVTGSYEYDLMGELEDESAE